MKITTCMPLYNGAKCVEQALISLKEQTRIPDEVIVVDDFSKDNCLDIVEKFRSDLPIKIFRNNPNLGMIRNWNACLNYSTGDLITYLHQDDGYLPGFLEKTEMAFNNNPKIGLWSCLQVMQWAIKDGKVPHSNFLGIFPPEEAAKFFYSWKHIPAPTSMVFRKEALNKAGYYDEYYRYAAEPDLYFRLIVAGYSFEQSGEVLVWRTSPDDRATAIFGHSNLKFDERFHFLNKWTQHPILQNDTILPSIAVEGICRDAGSTIMHFLRQGTFNQAKSIFNNVYTQANLMVKNFNLKVRFLSIDFLIGMFRFTLKPFSRVYRKLSSIFFPRKK